MTNNPPKTIFDTINEAKNGGILLVAYCLISVVVSVVSITSRQNIVVFDVKQTLNQFQQKLIDKGIDAPLHTAYIVKFSHALEAATKAYSTEHNAIILTTPAVVSGAKDVTHALQQRIIAQYQTTHNNPLQGEQ